MGQSGRTPFPAPALLSVLSALIPASCGGGQTRASPFDPGWVDDHGAAMASFQASFRAVRIPLGADVAVGVVGTKGLVGLPLGGGAAWWFAHAIHGRPAVAGSVVVAAGGGELFALEARTGKLLWSRPTGGRIRGAGDDGVTTVVSLLPTTGFGSLILAVARDGSVVRQLEDEAAVGVPAVAGDAAFLPWQGRFLSVYDLTSGEERARVAMAGGVSRVFASGGAIFAGETTFTRFDDRIRFAERGAASTAALPAPLGGLPGHPVWARPGTDWVEREAETSDRVRLYARPAAERPPGVEGGRFAATFYRVAMGFDAASGRLAWAHAADADFLGGAAYRGGFALCDASGAVTFLDARTGGVASAASLRGAVDDLRRAVRAAASADGGVDGGAQPAEAAGAPLVDACIVQVDGLRVGPAPNPTPLPEQIARVLRLRAPELSPLQGALARALARLPGRERERAADPVSASPPG